MVSDLYFIENTPKREEKKSQHQHRYTVVVAAKYIFRNNKEETRTPLYNETPTEWEATKVMCECGNVKEL